MVANDPQTLVRPVRRTQGLPGLRKVNMGQAPTFARNSPQDALQEARQGGGYWVCRGYAKGAGVIYQKNIKIILF